MVVLSERHSGTVFFGSCGSRYGPHATTNKAQEAPSFIGFHKHLLLEGSGLKFVFPWILVYVFSEADRILRLTGVKKSEGLSHWKLQHFKKPCTPLSTGQRERDCPIYLILKGLSYLSLVFLLCSILSLEDQ